MHESTCFISYSAQSVKIGQGSRPSHKVFILRVMAHQEYGRLRLLCAATREVQDGQKEEIGEEEKLAHRKLLICHGFGRRSLRREM